MLWINFCYLLLGSLPIWPDRVTMPAVLNFKEQFPNTTTILETSKHTIITTFAIPDIQHLQIG